MGSKQYYHDMNNELSRHTIKFQYTVARVMIKMKPFISKTKSIQVGQCLPTTCSTDDVRLLLLSDPTLRTCTQLARKLSSGEDSFTLKVTQVRTVPGEYRYQDDKRLKALAITCSITLIIMLLATMYECRLRGKNARREMKNVQGEDGVDCACKSHTNGQSNSIRMYETGAEDKPVDIEMSGRREKVKLAKEERTGILAQLFLCFSVCSNARVILSLDRPPRDSLPFLHGIRFMSLMWTIMVHTYLQVFCHRGESGMITGYIVFRLPTPPRISWLTNMILWLLSVGILLALVFGTWNGVLNIPLTAMYVSLGHSAIL
uniref:Uncharacterized protein n=1 Tax=Lutzomyia longipalpis TaxID=7200 RepID=A0A1B0CEX3_LUTLO